MDPDDDTMWEDDPLSMQQMQELDRMEAELYAFIVAIKNPNCLN